MIRTDTYSLVKSKWNEYKDVNDNDFKPLVDTIINSDQSFHILGRAGTGKSTLIKTIQAKLTEENKYILHYAQLIKLAYLLRIL